MTQATARQGQFAFNYAWLFDCKADILSFYVPLCFGTAVVLLLGSGPLLATFAMITLYSFFPMVGSLHGAATWFHYTDEKNQGYYFGSPKRILIFGIAPVLITLACAVAYILHLKVWVFWVYMIWTIQHLTQQNVGILLLYHNQGEAIVPRRIEALSQQIPAVVFAGLFFLHQYIAGPIFNLVFLFSTALLFSLFCHYIWCLLQKARSGASINVPAFGFWIISFWYYLPMLFVGDSYYRGMLLPLFVHWCQYVGLNLVLVARKYRPQATVKGKGRRPVAEFLTFCGIGTFAFTLIIYFSNTANGELLKEVLTALVMAGSLVHYFQDAFIWRFRDQFQRETILPFIKPERQPAAG